MSYNVFLWAANAKYAYFFDVTASRGFAYCFTAKHETVNATCAFAINVLYADLETLKLHNTLKNGSTVAK